MRKRVFPQPPLSSFLLSKHHCFSLLQHHRLLPFHDLSETDKPGMLPNDEVIQQFNKEAIWFSSEEVELLSSPESLASEERMAEQESKQQSL
jgi:hypothetical protein